MTTMEHLKTEIDWLDPEQFSWSDHEGSIKEILELPGASIAMIHGTLGGIWFITSYDAESISQKELQDRILQVFNDPGTFITFNGYAYAPVAGTENRS